MQVFSGVGQHGDDSSVEDLDLLEVDDEDVGADGDAAVELSVKTRRIRATNRAANECLAGYS